MQFKKIFITGGAGYVGSALVPALLAKGHEVTVYDLNIYDHHFPKHPSLVQIDADIRDKRRLIAESKGHDAMIHLACISNDPSFDLDPELGKSINFNASQNIIDACNVNRIRRLVVASSTSQYGIQPESLDVTEEVEGKPISDYAKYKLASEKLIRDSGPGFEYVFVRPATLCGYAPRLRLDLSVNILTIHALINKKIRIFGGKQMRPALNLKDMVRFYEFMLEAPKEKIDRQAFNISLKNVTIEELAKLVKKTIGNPAIAFEYVPSDDNRSYHVNTDKMKRVLGFECRYGFEDAILSIKEAYEHKKIIDGLNNPLYHNIKRMKEVKLR